MLAMVIGRSNYVKAAMLFYACFFSSGLEVFIRGMMNHLGMCVLVYTKINVTGLWNQCARRNAMQSATSLAACCMLHCTWDQIHECEPSAQVLAAT